MIDLVRADPCNRWDIERLPQPGDVVAYYPHANGDEFHIGVVGGEPRLLGRHTPVVRLAAMSWSYGRAGVPAAAIWALRYIGRAS